MRQPQRSREQLVVQRPLLTQPLLHCLAHLQQRKAGKLGVQVSRRLCKVVGTHRFTCVDDLLRDLIASRHHDDQDLRAIERYELDPLQHCRLVSREREADVLGGTGHEVRNRGKQIVHERRLHLLASKLLFDVHVRDDRSPAFEQQVHEGAVSKIGGDSASRGMRLVHVAVLFELRQDVANCG